jgi:hypothetical protein
MSINKISNDEIKKIERLKNEFERIRTSFEEKKKD